MDQQNTQDVATTQHLFAIRMNWLKWLMRPIRAIWRFIVFLARYFWSTCVIAWQGMKQAWNLNYCLMGALGGAAATLLTMLGGYLAAVTHIYTFSLIGNILAVLPIAWTFGEISAMIKHKQETGQDQSLKEHQFGNGIRVLKYIIIYVVVLVVLGGVQILLDLAGLIPGVGASAAGIVLLPNVISSVIMILTLILLYYALLVLPAHLLYFKADDIEIPLPPVMKKAKAEPDAEGEEETEDPEDTPEVKPAGAYKRMLQAHLEVTKSYFAMLRSDTKWLRYILILIPVCVLGLIISIPLLLLVGSALGLSLGIGLNVGVRAIAVLDPMSLVLPGGNPFIFLAFGAPLAMKIGGFFFTLSLAPILGAAYSLFWSNAANSFYLLYKEKRD